MIQNACTKRHKFLLYIQEGFVVCGPRLYKYQVLLRIYKQSLILYSFLANLNCMRMEKSAVFYFQSLVNWRHPVVGKYKSIELILTKPAKLLYTCFCVFVCGLS